MQLDEDFEKLLNSGRQSPAASVDEAAKNRELNVFSRMSVKSGKLKGSAGGSKERTPRQNGIAGPGLSSMLASGAASGLRPGTSPDDPVGNSGVGMASGISSMPRPNTSQRSASERGGRSDDLWDGKGEAGAMDPPKSARGDGRRDRRAKEAHGAPRSGSERHGGSSGSRSATMNNNTPSGGTQAKPPDQMVDTLDGLAALSLSDCTQASLKAAQEAESLETQRHNRKATADSVRMSLSEAARKRSRGANEEGSLLGSLQESKARPGASPLPVTGPSPAPGVRGTAGPLHSPTDSVTPSMSPVPCPSPPLGSGPSGPVAPAGPAPRSGRTSPPATASDSSPDMPKSRRMGRHATAGDDAPLTSRLAEGGSRLMDSGAAVLSARGPRSARGGQAMAESGTLGGAESLKSAPQKIVSPCPGAEATPAPPSPRTLELKTREKELTELLDGLSVPGPKGSTISASPAANRTLAAAKPEPKTKPERAPARGRVKPKALSNQSFEFKPISRSSSEGSMPSPTQKSRDRGQSTTSSIHSSRPSLTTTYVNFDKFDLQIENGRAPTQLMSWDQLLALVADKDWSVRQAIEWYGWPTPTKFQAVAIPCIIQACRNVGDAKSYTLLQAASGLGKTSAVALGLLASVRREVNSVQFIMVALEGCNEVEKYINALGCLSEIKVAYFKEEVSENLQADVVAAQGAQIIVGHPSHVEAVLKAAQDKLALNNLEILFMDDASNLIGEGLVQKVCEINQLVSLFAQKPLRYVVVSNFIEREAKPALRALKSSLMSKKNMFDLSQQVGRIRKCVKHYSLRCDPENWISSLLRLRSMIYIPRAVIFCDSEVRFQELKNQFRKGVRCEDGKELSIAIMDTKEQNASQRRGSLASFCKEQQDFLLTRSEPNIFQASLPRVFWIIHFGVESSNLSWYGCRLLCLDSQLRQKAGKGPQHDGVSILFMGNEKKEREKEKDKDKDTIPKLEKMFGIKFDSLPFGDI